MGLFSDKIFVTPIKNLVSMSSWNNNSGNSSSDTGIGSEIDRNGSVDHNDDGRTPPSPSPSSPELMILPADYSQQQQQQQSLSTVIRNRKTVNSERPFSTRTTLSTSTSMSLSSPSDFVHCYSSNVNRKKTDNIRCSSFDGHFKTPSQYKNVDTIKSNTSNDMAKYRMQQNHAIKLKSLRRTLSQDDESTSRQKALKAVLTELQTSLALAKVDVAHNNDNNIIKTVATNNSTKDNNKSKGVPFFVNRNNVFSKISKWKTDDCCNNADVVDVVSVSNISMKKNGFISKNKFLNNRQSYQAYLDDEEGSGSASMQQLSTSWEFIKLEKKPLLDAVIKTAENDKDEQQQDVLTPPRFIKISEGKISLGPPNISDNNKEKEILERRVLELESALQRVQDQLNHSQCGSPTLEKDLKEQLESMNRTIKSKERKAIQVCRDHKILQARFARQEAILQTLQQENKQLQQRVRQYEHCLDDVMRKVVDALVNEDSLREEVSMLKSRVKDLEAQNAALSASPAKGKDEGYCTMSSGQPQPSNSHLEDLPEEPEQWLLAAEPCSAEMEDWSMSQDELGVITLDDDSNEHEHDWIWNSSYLNSTMIDSQSEGITQLLRETIVYSDDEELTCTDFTRDFYKLVNIPSGSTRSLYSHMDAETDDEDDDEDDDDDDDDDNNDIEIFQHDDDEHVVIESGQNINNNSNNSISNGSNNNSDKKLNNIKTTKNKKCGPSPTPSEAGRALVTSCSSSESESLQIPDLTSLETVIQTTTTMGATNEQNIYIKESEMNPSSYKMEDENLSIVNRKTNQINNKVLKSEVQTSMIPQAAIKLKEIPLPSTSYNRNFQNCLWRKSNGWKRVATNSPKKEEQPVKKQPSPLKKSKIPPPVPVRRSYAS